MVYVARVWGKGNDSLDLISHVKDERGGQG